MSLDSAGRAMIAQQVKYHHDRLKLITSIRFTRGFLFEWLWLAYAGCQMMNMRQASEVQQLHLNCHYECTMWILNQVNLFRCWGSCRYCYVIWLIHPCCWYVLFICPLPYVSMGIVVLWVNYRQLNNLKINFWWWLLQYTYLNFCSFK